MITRSGHGGSSRKRFEPLAAALAFTVLSLFPQAASANGVVSPQVFTRGSFVYAVDERQITFLSMDTRSAHILYSADDSLFNIASAVRFGDIIWASNYMGAVVAVNMQTGAIEDFSRGVTGGGGCIDIDRRFVWLASGDTLYRMDLTSREWVKLPIPARRAEEVRGLISFNDQVHVVTSNAVYVLTTASDDWVAVPHNGFTLTPGDFRRAGDAAYLTQEKALYRYDPSKRLFAKAAAKDKIRAVNFASDRIDVVAGDRIYNFNDRNFFLEPQPIIPMLRGIRSIARLDAWTVGVVDKGLAIYASPFNFSIAPYSNHVNIARDAFAFSHDGQIILYTRGGFVIYSPDRKLWSAVRAVSRERARKGQYGWDENGAHVNFSEEYQSTPTGTVTFRAHPSMTYTDTNGTAIDPITPLANATLNLRTEDRDGRILDITVDNAATTLPPQKGFYYKGVDGDILDHASFGVQGTGLARSAVSPNVVTEGVSAAFSGKTAVDNRDRSFVTAAAGSGHILSSTYWRGFWYNSSGVYYIQGVNETRDVAPSSVKMYIDGIPLPETDFIYDPSNRAVRLLRRDKADPTSVIQVSFSERQCPNDRTAFEPLPKSHFGQYNFVEGAVSPRRWMSARAGFLTIDRDSGDMAAMVLAGIPIEWRGANGRSALIYPEAAYDSRLGTHSAGVTAGASNGLAFGSYRGQWVGDGFQGLDRPMFTDQGLRDEHEVNIGYDLRDNLRASWRQMHRRTEYNDLSSFELHTSYIGDALPDIEMSASSRFYDTRPGLEYNSSLNSRKESFMLRLSDLSSRRLSDMKGLHSVGYDFSWTEYASGSNQRGRVVYGLANISPLSSLTFTGTATYRLNPLDYEIRSEFNPRLTVNTRGLPRGFDISAGHGAYVSSLAVTGSNLSASSYVNGYFYPGEYTDALERIALYASYAREMEAHLPKGAPPLKYAFLSDNALTTLKLTALEAGLLYFPIDNLLLSTLNSMSHNIDSSSANYSTNELAKMWFESGSSIEAALNIGKTPNALGLNADALYEHRWASGLLTGAGAFGARHEENNRAALNGGPILMASITKDLSGYIRSIENSHYLRATLNRGDISNPDLTYSLYLRLKLPPNISLTAEARMDLEKMKKANIAANLYLHAGF
ncbi:MAG: hypothetical protein LBH93_08835 [Chitinispirillales bacterium]|jgi:hypothetical protein|nr:hypothetical protein [Chitinispirillales bacterium]